MGNPYNRKDFYNNPQQGMQPWESVQGWFDKIDLLVSEIKEVNYCDHFLRKRKEFFIILS